MLESHDVVPLEVGAEEDEEGESWRGLAGTSGVALVGGRQDLFSQCVDERFWEG